MTIRRIANEVQHGSYGSTEYRCMIVNGVMLEVWRFTYTKYGRVSIQTARNGHRTHYWSNDPETQAHAREVLGDCGLWGCH